MSKDHEVTKPASAKAVRIEQKGVVRVKGGLKVLRVRPPVPYEER